MPYTSASALTDEFGAAELIQLTDRATPYTGAIVTAVLDRAIEKADAAMRWRPSEPLCHDLRHPH